MFDGISSAAYSYQRYAKALHASRPVLLYTDAGVWVAQQGSRHPPGRNRVGLFFALILPVCEDLGGNRSKSRHAGIDQISD
jgi:hypothetical protein